MSAQQHTDTAQSAERQKNRNQNIAIAGFVLLSIIAIGFVVIRSRSGPQLEGINGADTENGTVVAAGKTLYATRCASCHGAQLQGAPGWSERQLNGVMPAPPLDARSPALDHDDEWIFRTIKEGGQATAPPGSTSMMPALGSGISDEQIWAVISYIKSTWQP